MFFSIVTLTYKRPELLEECIYSVLQQTCQDWELLIINDSYFQTLHYNHPQVRIFNIKERFGTIADKRNFGIENAIGDFILQLDDDDFLLPSYLDHLKSVAHSVDFLMSQRPILYYDDVSRICLSPVPQTNTFIYRRDTVGKLFRYQSSDTDEGITINPFYERIEKKFTGKRKYMQLRSDKCGHVWRQDNDNRRKYSLANYLENKIPDARQKLYLNSIKDVEGDIFLNPKWSKDYVSIIKKNMKTIDPMYLYSKVRGGSKLLTMAREVVKEVKENGSLGLERKARESIEEYKKTKPPEFKYDTSMNETEKSWQKVKPTWTNALKFIESMKSRGVISTALDAVGISNSSGERVSDEVLKQRRLSCFGDNTKNISECDRLKYIEKVGYFCGGCGCGKQHLARLDGDTPEEYTKLHYPQLECPLKKKGFSNEEKSLYSDIPMSIIIPVLNDNEELNLTIKSIRETSPSNVEIIVIDDKSDIPATVEDPTVMLIRLEERKGVGATRWIGAHYATTDYLLFVDSHMRFDKNWYNNAIQRLTTNPWNVVWCATCIGLEEGNMDITRPKGSYNGAELLLYGGIENQVFEGKWIPEKEGDEYEISCMMGACYFFHKKWFFHIKGTSSLLMWGSDEPLLSLKTWLAGGSIKIMKSVRIGHKFRSSSPYVTGIPYLIYNKMRSMYMLLPQPLYRKLQDKIPYDSNKQEAINMLANDIIEIESEREYYKSIFTKDIDWLCEKFKIKTL